MRSIASYLSRLRNLDEYSRLHSPAHSIHPVAAIVVATGYLITVMSYNRYTVIALAPLLLYPITMLALSGVPVSAILKPLLLVEPFVIGIGLLNPLLDSQPATVAGFTFARGWLVLFSIVIKCTLAISSALLLSAVLGIEKLAAGLRLLGVPKRLVLQMVLTYRYIWVLLGEAGKISRAYALRSNGAPGIRYRDWGTVAGSLLLRTYDRAERVHQAMLLRGFDGEYHCGATRPADWRDALFVCLWGAYFAAARFYDIPAAIGLLLGTA